MRSLDLALAGLIALAERQDGAVSTRQALAVGLTNWDLHELPRRHGWGHPVQGAYTIPFPANDLLARVRAVHLTCPAAVICGPTAAALHRMPVVPAEPQARGQPVHVLLPPRRARSQRRGIVAHWAPIPAADTTQTGVMRLTTVRRTVADLVLWSEREEAVAVLDAALRAGLLDEEDLGDLRSQVTARYGGSEASEWVALADPRAESPLESRLRLRLVDAGLPPEATQYEIHDTSGRLIARLDFAWPSRMLAVEADGAGPHGAPSALLRDRDRQNTLVAGGWVVLRFTWHDVLSRPGYVIAAIGTVLRQAA